MSAPFQPGDVVVCVDDKPRGHQVPPGVEYAPVKEGAIYRAIDVFLFHDALGECWACIINIDDPSDGGAWECDRFRKIDDEQYPEVLERLKALGKQRETAK